MPVPLRQHLDGHPEITRGLPYIRARLHEPSRGSVPPHESVIVNHDPSDDKRYAHEHIEVAVKDAFAAARRQLDDLA
jgi:hypothetical protein